jgi:DNA repair photolyase
MIEQTYRYALALSSQFYYCALPLRLDSYSQCEFNCLYCFANARGGRRTHKPMSSIDVAAFGRRLQRVQLEGPASAIDEFLLFRQPIHLGGMSDPFSPSETDAKTTLALLELLADHAYPTVISTKSDLFATAPYLRVLERGNFILQVSVSSADDALSKEIEPGTPGPTNIFRGLRELSSVGVPAMCRLQPLIPTREKDGYDVIDSCGVAGVRHVSVEYLKLPIEHSWGGVSQMSRLLGFDLREFYRGKAAVRVGREWVLPVSSRIDWILRLRSYAHSKGLTFGAADNDLLLLSDGQCCCSGVDLHRSSIKFFSHTYTQAARLGLHENRITITSLASQWCPEKSVAQFINSNSRIPAQSGRGAGLRAYIESGWNGTANGNSPASLHGVVDSGKVDLNGFRIYQFTDWMKALLSVAKSVP